MSAMEAALVSATLKIVGMKLAPLIAKEVSSIAGVTKDLEDLQDLVVSINGWLEKVGDKEIGNKKSSNWLKRLKDAAYDVEDVVHEFYMEAEKLDSNVVGINNIVIKYRLTLDRSNEQLLSSELKLKRLIESSPGWDVLRHLTGLQVLEISGCKDLRQLPESMRSLNCLLRLKLPESLGELSALRRLWIQSFQSLTSLPRFIQRLYALEELRIYNCPELIRRCKEGEGEDWHLVSHIPDLILR
ncbi:hypothetical protein QOZ80_5AG0396070 [Eleusine coracana subsp. coracana]|nr:hypothetical protein QOZ80_5AG0396070 [Eleusine coracana subsp. coracana]